MRRIFRSIDKGKRLPVKPVFISHASQNAERATLLVQELEGLGVSCWIAPRDIQPGENYGDQIVSGIKASSALVILHCNGANESKHIHRELELAINQDIPIIPVRTDASEIGSRLLYFLATTQWIDIAREEIAVGIRDTAQRIAAIMKNRDSAELSRPGADVARDVVPTGQANARASKKPGRVPVAGVLGGIAVLAAMAFLGWKSMAEKGTGPAPSGTDPLLAVLPAEVRLVGVPNQPIEVHETANERSPVTARLLTPARVVVTETTDDGWAKVVVRAGWSAAIDHADPGNDMIVPKDSNQMAVGRKARVSYNGTDGLWVRGSPSILAEGIIEMRENTELDVRGGPIETENRQWWQVEIPAGWVFCQGEGESRITLKAAD